MRTIFKYSLPYTSDRPVIDMPIDSKVLAVQVQRGEVYVWAMVDPDADVFEKVQFTVVGTGQACVNCGQYLGTIHLAEGTLVLHVFQGIGRGALSNAPKGK